MLYRVSVKDKKISLDEEGRETTFSDWQLNETSLENFVCEHPEIVFDDEESCLLVGRHLRDKESKINDLVALDGNGNLILIELKRDKKDMKHRAEPLEFQAIRYCASLATITTPDDLVEKSYAEC